jgi:hypothetical protein
MRAKRAIQKCLSAATFVRRLRLIGFRLDGYSLLFATDATGATNGLVFPGRPVEKEQRSAGDHCDEHSPDRRAESIDEKHFNGKQ